MIKLPSLSRNAPLGSLDHPQDGWTLAKIDVHEDPKISLSQYPAIVTNKKNSNVITKPIFDFWREITGYLESAGWRHPGSWPITAQGRSRWGQLKETCQHIDKRIERIKMSSAVACPQWPQLLSNEDKRCESSIKTPEDKY